MATIEEHTEPRVTLGDLLKRARLDVGLDQAGLAEKIGTSRASVGAWERDRSQPDFGWIRKIVAVTGANWLYTEPFRDELRRRSRCLSDYADQPLFAMAV